MTDGRSVDELLKLIHELKTKNAERTHKLIEHGFPPLGEQGLTHVSSSSQSVDHDPATFVDSLFLNLNQVEIVPSESSSWITYESSRNIWSTESDIQGLVKMALTDVIATTKMNDKIRLFNELSTFSIRPDICLILANGKPIGVCEVKKPNVKSDSSALDKPKLAGHILDYMIMLQNFHGIRYVFGLITTYSEWRICWLPHTDVCAAASERIQNHPPIISHGVEERIVHCSPKYKCTDQSLIPMLCSVIHKMYNSPFDPPTKLVDPKRTYIELSESSFQWANLPKEIVSGEVKLSYKLPHGNSNRFYLLLDYHGGADGRVWLACSTSGCLVVIKFGSVHNGQERLEAESNHWRTIWDVSTRVVTLHRKPALLMPFAFHGRLRNKHFRFLNPNHWPIELKTDADEREVPIVTHEIVEDKDLLEYLTEYNNKPMTVLQTALTEMMITKGVQHGDLEWRHVALLPSWESSNQKWTLKPILIDMARLSPLTDLSNAERVKLMHEQIDSLKIQLENE